ERGPPGARGRAGAPDWRSGTPSSRPRLDEPRFGRAGDAASRGPPPSHARPATPTHQAAKRSDMSKKTGELANRVVNGDELGAVGERPLDLHLLEHLGHPFHHVVAAEDVEARRHQIRDAPAVANAFEDLGRDERERLRVVQLEAAPASPAG